MACTQPKRERQYSSSWSYPGHYPGYDCHPETPDQGTCLPDEDTGGGTGGACASSYYDYIDVCKGYPYDLTDLDKPIDLMSNPSNQFYDLND